MAEQPDPTPHGPALGAVAQVVAEHDRLAVDDRHEAGARAQERGLAGAVGSVDEGDRAPLHVEVDTGEGGKPAEQRDRGTKVDDGLHDDVARLLAPLRPDQGGDSLPSALAFTICPCGWRRY